MATKSYTPKEIRNDHLKDIVSQDVENQATHTYLGSEIKKLPTGLPKETESLCPECLKVIAARLFDEDGMVFMEKSCPEHGDFREIYWSDTSMYLRAEKYVYGDGRGIANPKIKNATVCPEHCGLCNMHVSHTALGNIDLTNRCNMTCPVCFANANSAGYVYEPSYEEIVDMLRAYREMEPVPGRVVQFSGGEPTIHPRFHDIVRAAKDMDFSHVQMASNGLKLADPEFAEKTAEAGMHTIYLQFDGVDDESHYETRGKRGYFEKKLKAIENCRKTGMRIVLVPTIVKNFNREQVGPILKFAVENSDVIGGISFQPVALTGRIDEAQRHEMRYTIPDLIHDLHGQTGLVEPDDFFPIACTSPFSKLAMALRGEDTINITCHPHCSLATYMVVDPKRPLETATPLPQYVDVPGMLEMMNQLAFKMDRSPFKFFHKIKAFTGMKKFFDEKKAPEGLTFTKFLESMNGTVDKDLGRNEGGTEWKFLLVGAMHFMDAYNYEVERVKRCVIHYSTPGGFMYPFCAYNSGPVFRDRVEKRNSVPLDEYKAG